jgi:hypothetical protein
MFSYGMIQWIVSPKQLSIQSHKRFGGESNIPSAK